MDVLRPGYKLPSRKTLANKHLDEVTKEIEDDMKANQKGKSVTLVEDGWSNIHNDPVIASCLNVDGRAYFLDAHDTGTMPKTAENCKNLCQATIQCAKEKYECDVKSIVTDNAKNVEKMRKELEDDDPSLTVYGCLSHWLNLLGQTLPHLVF